MHARSLFFRVQDYLYEKSGKNLVFPERLKYSNNCNADAGKKLSFDQIYTINQMLYMPPLGVA